MKRIEKEPKEALKSRRFCFLATGTTVMEADAYMTYSLCH